MLIAISEMCGQWSVVTAGEHCWTPLPIYLLQVVAGAETGGGKWTGSRVEILDARYRQRSILPCHLPENFCCSTECLPYI